jgi:hypothetical protein
VLPIEVFVEVLQEENAAVVDVVEVAAAAAVAVAAKPISVEHFLLAVVTM